MIACLLITQPPNDWLDQFSDDKTGKLDEEYVTPLGWTWSVVFKHFLQEGYISKYVKKSGQNCL